MKKLIAFVALLVAGLLGYNYVTTGKVTLVPGGNLSAIERQLDELEDEFEQARKQASRAYRTASVSGVDSTSDLEAARSGLGRIKQSLQGLRQKLDTDASKRKAQQLADAIREFEQQLR